MVNVFLCSCLDGLLVKTAALSADGRGSNPGRSNLYIGIVVVTLTDACAIGPVLRLLGQFEFTVTFVIG